VQLDAVARLVRSGLSLRHALAAHPDGWLAPAARRAAANVPWPEVLGALDARREPERVAAAALGFAANAGGPVAETLDRAAAVLRDLQHDIDERRAQSANARLSALVMTLLPAAFGTWVTLTDARVRAFTLGSPAGAACVLAGTGCLALGWWWMHRIIASGSP
jgi:tight adherence protein B